MQLYFASTFLLYWTSSVDAYGNKHESMMSQTEDSAVIFDHKHIQGTKDPSSSNTDNLWKGINIVGNKDS